jgi:hypothetical protein
VGLRANQDVTFRQACTRRPIRVLPRDELTASALASSSAYEGIAIRHTHTHTHTHTHAYVNTWNLTALQYLQARFPSADDRNGMGSFGRCHRTAGDPVSAGHFDFRYQIQPGNIRDFLDSSHGDDASPSSHLSWLWLELLVGNGLAKTIRVMAHPAAAVLLSSSAALL